MSQGRDQTDWSETNDPAHGDGTDPVPMPPIRGVRPRNEVESNPSAHAGLGAESDDPHSSAPTDPSLDPWGIAHESDLAPEEEPAPAEPEPRRRGGGILTIPLLCIGLATIACVTLLPLADENHRLAWEREKLNQDLAHLKEQTRVNDQFLLRVADDLTLAERLAQRQMKYIREGTNILPLGGPGGRKEEMSPFQLVTVPPPAPLPEYQPVGGPLAQIIRQPRAQLYLIGGSLLLIAMGLVLGYVPKPRPDEQSED